jgi:hypothetical protein
MFLLFVLTSFCLSAVQYPQKIDGSLSKTLMVVKLVSYTGQFCTILLF